MQGSKILGAWPESEIIHDTEPVGDIKAQIGSDFSNDQVTLELCTESQKLILSFQNNDSREATSSGQDNLKESFLDDGETVIIEEH